MKTYNKFICPICGKRISTNGLGRAAHGRAHVRRGEAIEISEGHKDFRGVIEFIKAKDKQNTEIRR